MASERDPRSGFLLRLRRQLRPLVDYVAIQREATQLLGDFLEADRVFFSEADIGLNQWVVRTDFFRVGPSLVGIYPFTDWPMIDRAVKTGEPVVIADIANSPIIPVEQRGEFESIGIRSLLSVMLVKDERPVAALVVTQAEPRAWAQTDVELVTEVADKIWAAIVRGRAEIGFARSEERYRALFNSMDQGFCIVEVYFEDEVATDYRFLETNPMFEEQTGLHEAVGRTMRELVPDLEEHWFEIYGRVAASGQPVRFSQESEAMGRWFDVYAFRIGDPSANQVAILFTDITARKLAEDRLTESEERARTAIEVAQLGTFRFDPITNTFVFDERMQALWEHKSPDPISAHEVLSRIHPDHRERIDTLVRSSLRPDGEGEYTTEFPIVLSTGEERWLFARAKAHFRGKGRQRKAVSAIGSVVDITQRKLAEVALRQSEERFRQLADTAPVLIWLNDAEDQAEYVNAEYIRFTGKPAEALLGGEWQALVHPDDRDEYVSSFQTCTAERRRFEAEFRFLRADGEYRWMLSVGVPRFEQGTYLGYVGSTSDIHDRKLAEASQRAREDSERRRRQEAELLNLIMSQLEAIDSVPGRARRLVELLVPDFASFASIQIPGELPEKITIGEGEPTVQLHLPIGTVRPGTLRLRFADPAAESRTDHLFAREIAERAALLIGNARLQAEQVRVASELQKALLPVASVSSTEVEVAARYESGSDGLEVGGDWYDSFNLREGRIGLAVGDVVGAGLEAAAAMGRIRTALVALASQTESPAQLLDQLDEFVSGPNGSEFATAFYATLDPANGRLSYASAAHPPPLLITPDEELLWLEGGRSLPLGLGRSSKRSEATLTMAPGSVLIVYSDGLVERRGESLNVGLARLADAARTHAKSSAEDLCELIVRDLRGGLGASDDTVIMCVRLLPADSRPFRRRFPARPEELSALRVGVRGWLDEREVDSQEQIDLILALGEACSNAVEHAYRDQPRGEVDVQIRVERAGLAVQVRDFGVWKEPNQIDQKRRRGTDIMKKLTESFRRETGEQGTVVAFTVPMRVPG